MITPEHVEAKATELGLRIHRYSYGKAFVGNPTLDTITKLVNNLLSDPQPDNVEAGNTAQPSQNSAENKQQ